LTSAIGAVGGYYRQLAGDQASLFLLSGHGDGRGVFENVGVPARAARGWHDRRHMRSVD
jgi:hypothetical protein